MVKKVLIYIYIKEVDILQKQAILILAHRADKVLPILIEQCDSEYFDIYIHFDKKEVDNQIIKDIRSFSKKSKIVIISTQKVVWGSPSVMKADLIYLKWHIVLEIIVSFT